MAAVVWHNGLADEVTGRGILEYDAALLVDEFHGEAVYHMPWITLAHSQFPNLVATDALLIDGAPYVARAVHRPNDGATLHVLLAEPQ